MSRPRIAFVTDMLGTHAGSEASLVAQAEMMARAGCPVLVAVYPRDDPALPYWCDRLRAAGVELVVAPSGNEQFAVASLSRAIEAFAASVIHFLPMGQLLVSWRQGNFNRTIVQIGTESSEASERCFWYDRSAFKAFAELDAIVAPCRSVADGVRRLFQYAGKVAILPHPINTEHLTVRLHTADEIAPPYRLAAISRLRVEKGIEFMLASISILARTHDVRLDVFGEAVELQRGNDLCAALGIAQRVRFAGPFQGDRAQDEIFRDAHLLLLSSLFEGQSLAVMNGIARGRLTVATRVGGVPELLEPIDPTMVVPVADPAAMANAVRGLLDSPKKLVALEGDARKHFLESFGPKAVIDKHTQFYESLTIRGNVCG